MQGNKPSLVVGVALLVIAGLLITFPASAAGQFQVLHAFTGGNDGAISWAGQVFDAAGNLYGTTMTGGAYGYGTVFKLMPGANGV